MLCVYFKNTLKISKILKHQGKQQVLLIPFDSDKNKMRKIICAVLLTPYKLPKALNLTVTNQSSSNCITTGVWKVLINSSSSMILKTEAIEKQYGSSEYIFIADKADVEETGFWMYGTRSFLVLNPRIKRNYSAWQ